MSLISREAALEGLEDLNIASFYEDNEHSKEAYLEIKSMLESLPEQESYLYGYNIESLVTIAEIMKREKISPEEALWIFKHDILKVVEIVRAEMQEAIQRSFEQAYFLGGHDDTRESL